jgi:hypothetical protein
MRRRSQSVQHSQLDSLETVALRSRRTWLLLLEVELEVVRTSNIRNQKITHKNCCLETMTQKATPKKGEKVFATS